MNDNRVTMVSAARVLVVCLLLLGAAAPSMHGQQPPRTTAAQDGFVPADTLPPGDPLPAAPLLITAYAVAWLAIMFYIWSVWRRLSRVEGELAALGRRVAEPERRGGAR